MHTLTIGAFLKDNQIVKANMKTKREPTTIKEQLKKEDKAGLGYIIGFLNHHDPATIYWDNYLKKDLFKKVMSYKDKWYKLKQFKTYNHFF